MPDYSNLSVLIVDPNQSMRASVHNMLTQVNITKVDQAVSAATAIRALTSKSYDVILCEYDLGTSADGAGQDGQQLLEDLRHHKVIGPGAIFVMLTSEGVYSKVVSAAELLPTDYILKPFTVDVLSQRIGRALERRAVFLPVYQLIGQGRAREAIDICLRNEAAQPRYAIDYARLRAEVLASLGRHADAEQAYTGILNLKTLGWAQLGQARAVYALGRLADAEALLRELLAGNPKFIAAYDLLAQLLRDQDKDADAKQVLEDAVALSPHMVRRLRNLGDVALASGDVAGAEKAYKQVVAKAKYSEFRDPADHVNLVRALVHKGDAAGAASVVRDLERSMRSTASVEVCRCYASSMVKQLNGDTDGAAAELAKAMEKLAEATGMSANLKLGLAHSCLETRLDEQAEALFNQLIANPNSGVDAEQVTALCKQAGRQDIAKRYVQTQEQAVDGAVREAAALSRSGDIRGAVAVLQDTLQRYPDHTDLWSVSVTTMLRLIGELGWDAQLATQCTMLMRRMREHNPQHPLLPGLLAQYATARQKAAANPTPSPAESS
ncbi:response regulator [Pseudoduganella sp. FT55W]|uniref:Response regulator n=1 Tax=Duganella rivi TaxID=2666083 RepID=A0A7X4GPT9_9BURK|nr:tetratricopeptide repeat-containing response regulator [Duganella rivi]MYM67406.1 response regulator [Duganella rivi]